MPDPFIDSIYQQTTDFLEHKELIFSAVLQLNAKVVVELGTDVGDSTRILASALFRTQGHLWTIDLAPPRWNEEVMALYKHLLTLITSDSLTYPWTNQIDLLMIDSDHSKDHVKKELDKYGVLVKRGGFIILHDTHHSAFGGGITEAINEWTQLRGLPWKDFPEHHGLGVIYV